MNKTTVTGIIFTLTLIGILFVQLGVKPEPQIYLLGFGILNIFLAAVRVKYASEISFLLLFMAMLFLTLARYSTDLMYYLLPDLGTVIVDGERYRVMDSSFIWTYFGSFILTLIVSVIYQKHLRTTGKKMELGFCIIYSAITLFTWLAQS